MRTVCTGCGFLGETKTGAELGQPHTGCMFPPGEWAPFPELGPRLIGDLAVQQLTPAPLDDVLHVFTEVLAALDDAWQEKRSHDADLLLLGVRDVITTRLSWEKQTYPAGVGL